MTLVLAVPVPPSLAADAEAPATPAVAWATVSTAIDTLTIGDRDVCLSHGYVDRATLQVRIGRTVLQVDDDFTFDARRGCLHIRDLVAWRNARCIVAYAYFPFPLKLEYARRRAVVAGSVPADSVVTAVRSSSTDNAPEGAADLRIRGYKTFAVKLGSNRDPTLNQALDLDVSGEIASGVELRALLSDRDLPLQAEGNTETLSELDRVMLQVRTRTLAATLGDYDIQAFGGDFLSYSKRLEGLKAEGDVGTRGFVLAAAVAKGEFVSLEIQGVEGKQGPYALTDAAGSDAISVVAGTESVWLDGVRLQRGESNDYTIDYARAELTFTAGNLITTDSRITVDFEFTTQAYERNFYVGGARSEFLDGRLSMSASVVSEADDDGSPITILSDEERAALAASGDSTRTVTDAAGIYVGPGNGDYLAIDIGEERVRYQYAGAGGGDHTVNFVDVGLGAGDYADSTTVSGLRAFRYVGPDKGTYLPARTLAAPEAHRLADVTATFAEGERFNLSGEFAASGLDRNTFSSLDDFDNNGTASRLRLNVRPWGDADRGLELRGGIRDVGRRFEPLGRIRQADYAYTWNAPAAAFADGERLVDGGVEWRPVRGLSLDATAASTRSDLFDGQRQRLDMRLGRRMRGRGIVERVDGDSRAAAGAEAVRRSRDLETAEVEVPFGWLVPRARFDREERIERQDDGTRSGTVFERYDVGSSLAFGAGGTIDVGWARRIDRSLGTGSPWRDARRSIEQRYDVALPRWRNVGLNGSFTRRTSKTVATGERQVSDLAQLDLVSSQLEGTADSEIHLDVTTSDVASRQLELVFVGEGAGLYDAFGRFVGSGGDYDLRRLDSPTSNLRTRLRLNARTELRPSRLWRQAAALPRWKRWLRLTGYETTVLVDESSRLDLASPSRLFDPSSYQRRDATFDGLFRLRQDLDLFEVYRLLSVRLRYEREDRADNRTGGVFQDAGEEHTSVRLRSSPGASWSVEWTGTAGNRFTEDLSDDGGRSRLDLRETEQAFELTLRPGRGLRWSTMVSTRGARDRLGDGESRAVELKPTLTWNRRKLRTDLRYVLANQTVEGSFPSSFGLIDPPGRTTEYGVVVDYRATQVVTVTGTLDGVGRPGRAFIHTARMEVRAAF